VVEVFAAVEVFAVLVEDVPLPSVGASKLVVVGAGLLALVIAVIAWPIVRFAITIAHEGGHAFTASMMGGAVDSIEIYRRNDPRGRGVTFFRAGPFATFLAALAGYLGPSVFGLVGALLLTKGQVKAVLWLSLVFLLLALLQSGNLLGFVSTISTGALIGAVLRYASEGQQLFFTYTWIWFLLIGGWGHVLLLQAGRRSGPDNGSDAYQLRKMTFLPASLWSGLFWLGSLAALIYGAGILLGIVQLDPL
jgi:hypothetical protein